MLKIPISQSMSPLQSALLLERTRSQSITQDMMWWMNITYSCACNLITSNKELLLYCVSVGEWLSCQWQFSGRDAVFLGHNQILFLIACMGINMPVQTGQLWDKKIAFAGKHFDVMVIFRVGHCILSISYHSVFLLIFQKDRDGIFMNCAIKFELLKMIWILWLQLK